MRRAATAGRACCSFRVAPALLKLEEHLEELQDVGQKNKKTPPKPRTYRHVRRPHSAKEQVSVCQVTSFRSAALRLQGEREPRRAQGLLESSASTSSLEGILWGGVFNL